MTEPRLLFSVMMVACALLGGCAFDTPESRPGVSRREAKALGDSYGWLGNLPLTNPGEYTDDSLVSLFAESTNPALDGDRAESHASALMVALAASGDDRFAAVLSRQPAAVRSAVLRDVSPLWADQHLRYPRTEALLE